MPLAPRHLLGLLTGLALGAGGAFAFRFASADHSTLHLGPVAITQITLPSAPSDRAALSLLLPPRLAGPEADAALAAWLALPPLPGQAPAAEVMARAARLRALLSLLPASAPERLLSALATRPGPAEAGLRELAFEVWAERDAPAAARWVVALVPGEAIDASARARLASVAAFAWGESAFDAAYAWATALPDAGLGSELARQLLTQLAATDPARAVALARAAGDEFFQAGRLAIFTAWAAQDPVAAVQALGAGVLEKEPKPWASPSLLEALGKWYLRAPQPALDWILAQSTDYDYPRNRLLERVCFQLAQDPATARTGAALLLAHPEQPDHREALRPVIRAWIRVDSPAAMAWLDSLSNHQGERSRAIHSTLGNTYDFHFPIDSYLAVARLLPENSRDRTVWERLYQWLLGEPGPALAWIEAHDLSEFGSAAADAIAGAQGRLLARLAETDPATALTRWQNLPAGTNKTYAAGPLALAWARTDPAAAARWLTSEIPTLPDAAPSASYINDPISCCRHIAFRLTASDPHALMQLAETMTDPELRKTLCSPLYDERWESETTLSHAERAALLSGIPDDETRVPMLTTLLGSWLRQDFPSARAWLEGNEVLPPGLAARLLLETDPFAPGAAAASP